MKDTQTPFFGVVNSLADASISQEPESLRSSFRQQNVADEAMYEYKLRGTLDGIQVAPRDRKLQFNDEDELRQALRLARRERVFLEWLSPDTGKDKYADLLERANSGDIIIEEQTLQYDAGKSAFMALVRYCEVEYALAPRYEFIRDRNG